MPQIEIRDIKVSYYNKKSKADIPVFNHFSLNIPNGKTTVILGASGCGKTTLLNVIAGLHHPEEGEIFFDEKDSKTMTIRDRDVSYVKQDLWLYPFKTIFDNIAFPLKFCDIDQNEVYFRVRDIARKMGIEACLTRLPKHISLGQQKRAALARALVKEPTLILFDEPLSSLDPILKKEMMALIQKSVSDINATAVYVTHDYQEALALADYLIILGENEIICQGDKETVLHSGNPYLKTLEESISYSLDDHEK